MESCPYRRKQKMHKAEELTVAQVRRVMDDLENEKSMHVVDLLFPDGIPALAISLSTGISIEELDGEKKPSEIAAVIEEVKAANPFFVKMLRRLARLGENVLQEKASTKTSAD